MAFFFTENRLECYEKKTDFTNFSINQQLNNVSLPHLRTMGEFIIFTDIFIYITDLTGYWPRTTRGPPTDHWYIVLSVNTQ